MRYFHWRVIEIIKDKPNQMTPQQKGIAHDFKCKSEALEFKRKCKNPTEPLVKVTKLGG